MIPFLSWGPLKLPGWVKAGLGGLIGGLLMLPVGYCSGAQAMKDKIEARQAAADRKDARLDSQVKEKISGKRVEDTLRVEAESKERIDAIREGLDDDVSGPELRRNCRILRKYGVPESELAGRCGPPG